MEEVEVEREAGVMTKDPGGHHRGARQGFCTDTVSVFLSSFMGLWRTDCGRRERKGNSGQQSSPGEKEGEGGFT